MIPSIGYTRAKIYITILKGIIKFPNSVKVCIKLLLDTEHFYVTIEESMYD
jgi:hypothetical protein